MRRRTLFILGIVLTLSGASDFRNTASSIAQVPSTAREVRLLPLVEEVHAARRHLRFIGTQSTWRQVAVSARSVIQPLPQPIQRTYLAAVDQPDIQERHKIIATEILSLLPASCQRQIQNFYVRYEKPERRGLAGKNTIILDGTLSDEEFRAVLIHEAMGHLFDLGCLQGSAASGKSPFLDGSDPVFNDDPSAAFYRISWNDARTKRTASQPEDFVSGYAQNDPFEDMAETVIYFVLQHDTFVERARSDRALAAKLKWFETFLPVQPMPSDTLAAAWDGAIPWDATKLKYTWSTAPIASR